MVHFTQNAIFDSLFRYAERVGVRREEICDAAGTDLAAASTGGALVPAAAIFDAAEFISEAAGQPNFGLLMAERVDSRIIGFPALVAERCGSIRDYYALIDQYLRHHTTGYSYSLDEDEGGAVGRLRFHARGRFRPCQFAEAALAVHARTFRQFLGDDWRPGKILLAHKQIGSIADYRRGFGTEVVFEAGQYGLTFSAEDLRWRAPSHAAVVRGQLVQVGAAIEADTISRTSMTIRAFLANGEAKIDVVAASLSLTARSLQRRLALAGTSFSELLAAVRLSLAREYLTQPGARATEVAARLGFSDLTALSRFLRQKTGASSRDLMRQRQV